MLEEALSRSITRRICTTIFTRQTTNRRRLSFSAHHPRCSARLFPRTVPWADHRSLERSSCDSSEAEKDTSAFGSWDKTPGQARRMLGIRAELRKISYPSGRQKMRALKPEPPARGATQARSASEMAHPRPGASGFHGTHRPSVRGSTQIYNRSIAAFSFRCIASNASTTSERGSRDGSSFSAGDLTEWKAFSQNDLRPLVSVPEATTRKGTLP